MLKAVIDTNVIISAALAIVGGYWNDARFVFQTALIEEGRFHSITSVPILYELGDVLSRASIGIAPEQAGGIVTLFAGGSTFVATFGLPMGGRDRKDDKVIEAALNANADCIVSRDHDLFEPRARYGIAKVGPGIRGRPIRTIGLAEFATEIRRRPRFGAPVAHALPNRRRTL